MFEQLYEKLWFLWAVDFIQLLGSIAVKLLVLFGVLQLLAGIFPSIQTLKANAIIPIARKWKFRRIRKAAVKADIKGNVNKAVLKMSSEFPSGWIKPLDFEFVETTSHKDFIEDNEAVIRMRPVEDQTLNFVTAVYYFLRKSFFPKTKNVVPDNHFEASVLFSSQKLIKLQKPELIKVFNEHILDPELDRMDKLVHTLARYENIDSQGFFTGTFLREVHAVAELAKRIPLRTKMREEVNNILGHIESFLKYYNDGVKSGQWSNTIPADMWIRLGPVTNYSFLLIGRPLTALLRGKAPYVNKAKEKLTNGATRLYVLGAADTKKFANEVISAIVDQVTTWQLIERFDLSNDYRGEIGGVGALFVKR